MGSNSTTVDPELIDLTDRIAAGWPLPAHIRAAIDARLSTPPPTGF